MTSKINTLLELTQSIQAQLTQLQGSGSAVQLAGNDDISIVLDDLQENVTSISAKVDTLSQDVASLKTQFETFKVAEKKTADQLAELHLVLNEAVMLLRDMKPQSSTTSSSKTLVKSKAKGNQKIINELKKIVSGASKTGAKTGFTPEQLQALRLQDSDYGDQG